MPDVINSRERRLIDAELAKGRVTRVPAGKMATAVDFQWVSSGKRSGRLEAVEAQPRKSLDFRRRTYPKVARRRERVAELIAAFWTPPEIAAELGISVAMVNSDKMELGLRVPRNASTLRRVLTAYQPGVTAIDLSRRLGVAPSTVRKALGDLRARGLIDV
ncbi:winged helix-turn-helix transcriptional regulator [Shimia ponticola]|uniref:winged helix-turn-helix transcriptional regulator n=1 Tax=Shimia ponticola TaxID=2582893 RepID=UPI00164BEDF4|nr:winged helix-turn-helix transcriptional regulator [Shimia ponticola]